MASIILNSFIIKVSLYTLCVSFLLPISVSFKPSIISSSIKTCKLNMKMVLNTKGNLNTHSLLEKVDTILNSQLNDFTQRKKEILAGIITSHAKDAEFSASFGSEESVIGDITTAAPISVYKWLYANGEDIDGRPSKRKLAIQTIDPDQPILDQESISIIRGAAQKMWDGKRTEAQVASQSISDSKAQDKYTESQFTYQMKGNYEAHLVHLANNFDDRIRTIMIDALGKKIYPLVRKVFRPLISDLDDFDLSVYDSLVIRYNSTEAMMVGNNNSNNSTVARFGAGQPLHRDLGIVSVNIMLNSDEEFQGGGTMFENQLHNEITKGDGVIPSALKPIGVGHAIAHLSNERHAGVGTTDGLRDILVIFLTASSNSSASNVESTIPNMEKAARLKTSARKKCNNCDTLEESILCRMMHQRLALQFSPADGEAWHYIGMSLREHAKTEKDSQALGIMQLSISCLEQAAKLIPCDGRLCNNFGLALETLSTYITATDKTIISGDQERIIGYYKRSVRIHQLCEQIGCDVSLDLAMVILNYGLYFANQDEFEHAVKILLRFRFFGEDIKYSSNSEQSRIINDGFRLLNFCVGKI